MQESHQEYTLGLDTINLKKQREIKSKLESVDKQDKQEKWSSGQACTIVFSLKRVLGNKKETNKSNKYSHVIMEKKNL